MKTSIFSIILVALFSSLISCTRPDGSRRVLEDSGYTNVEITGYRFFTCDKNDTFCTGFKATSPTGKKVTGAVGSGLLKSYTIRLD